MEVLKLIIELIDTLLRWPVVALIALFIFRKAISTDILRRLIEANLEHGDTKFKIRLAEQEFRLSVEQSGKEFPERPILQPPISSTDKELHAFQESQHNTDIDKILEVAQSNPKLGIISRSQSLKN